MIGKPFINESLSNAIENYLKYKNNPESEGFNEFKVMVIRSLIYIYGELDIINPYITQNEKNMGGFDNNLTKYGFSPKDLENFKKAFMTFEEEKKLNKKPNTSFIELEKYLIKMYFCKVKTMNIPKEKQEEFKNYLYLETNPSPYIQNDINKYLIDKQELSLYFNSIGYEKSHNFQIEELRRSTLIPESYILLGYTMDQITKLNDIDLRNVNNQVYKFFKIDPNLEDKSELLQKAVNYYKKYGNKITSGNGYVDFLLFASMLCTGALLAVMALIR